eukprot:TRINITY_DN79576_c0_g1_i1.p1 TRINITY_DN79576_c0_g1~~TRINITY_DN79576_c0_g1_i1.p1  ORF type:complete len:327 (-),score=66.31 TRINITY_DN79576_c0_g1_i1:141-1121(-)
MAAKDCNSCSQLPGYSLTPAADGTGGWLAHRSAVDMLGSGPGVDWTKEAFADPGKQVGADLSSASSFQVADAKKLHKPRILILYGSLRDSSLSKLLAYECARLLELLGADVRVFHPKGLPVYDPSLKGHPKAREMLSLALWAEGHVWVSPEMHSQMTSVFKNQIDWIPLSFGAVRPTQGKTAVVLQVSGGSQSFNVVNDMRRIARWMRMPCCTNQATVPQAWNEFDKDGRMKPSSTRDRVIDVMEEFYQFTLIMREHVENLNNRYSERKQKAQQGQLTAGLGAHGGAKPAAEPQEPEEDDLLCCPGPSKKIKVEYVQEGQDAMDTD